MATNGASDGARSKAPWRLIGWSIAALLMVLPLIANAPWTPFDFIAMGVLLGSAGLVLELAMRSSGSLAYRSGALCAVAATFLLVWVNGAVGFLGKEDNPANLMFFGVIAIAALGSIVAGFRPAGMARTMFATAAAQVAVGAIGLSARLGSSGSGGLYEVAMGTTVFTSLWLLSGTAFRKAAGDGAEAAGTG